VEIVFGSGDRCCGCPGRYPGGGADSGPQPKVEYVDNVHWSQEADGSGPDSALDPGIRSEQVGESDFVVSQAESEFLSV
jgi:hypothetical protein